MNLGVIGISGRNKQESALLSKTLFRQAVTKVRQLVQYVWKISPSEIVLISGGSSWFDHIVLVLFLEQLHDCMNDATLPMWLGIRLYLPCIWDRMNARFCDQSRTGKRLNQLHGLFSQAMGYNTLDDIQSVYNLQSDKQIQVHETSLDNFFYRNFQIAGESTNMIAFSNGSLEMKSDDSCGGTLYTWSKFKKRTAENGGTGVYIPVQWIPNKTLSYVNNIEKRDYANRQSDQKKKLTQKTLSFKPN